MKNILSDQHRKAAIIQRINELAEPRQGGAKHRQLWHLENLSAGVHHSGQLSAWKLVIETLSAKC